MARNQNPLEGLEPEMVDGPLGLPILKPKALPDPPDSTDIDFTPGR